MRAVVYDRYGDPDVLQVREVDEPVRARGCARVRVLAAALNPKDVLVRKGRMRWMAGRRLPRTPGYDIAGVLMDEAGGLPAGAEVFGMIDSHLGGGCAEIVSLPTDQVALKPGGLSMVEAASLPLTGLTALQALRDELGLGADQTVLLNGASGGVGTMAIQVAKALGAEVTAVCSVRNEELVRGLGADHVVDYARTRVSELRGFDAVFDIYGSYPFAKARRSLARRGRYCTTIPGPGSIARGLLRQVGLHRAALVVVKSRRADLDVLRRWVEQGRLQPVIDRVVSLANSADGHRYLETRRARGKVVIDLCVD